MNFVKKINLYHAYQQPPKEINSRTNSTNVTSTILGTLLFVLLINSAAKMYLHHYTTNAGYSLLNAKWDMLYEIKQAVDILVLGDSSGNQGIDPRIICNKLDMSALNLCTIGGAGVVNDILMLDYYLEKFKPPKFIIIIHAYDVWGRKANLSVISKIPGKWWRNNAYVDLSFSHKIQFYLNRNLPLYFESTSLAQIIKKPWILFKKKTEIDPNGFMARTEGNPDKVLEDSEHHMSYLRQEPKHISNMTTKVLEQIQERAEKYKFDVFIVSSPIYEGIYRKRNFREHLDKVQNAIKRVVFPCKRIHFVLYPPMTFSKEGMETIDHITLGASKIFTTQLAEEIILKNLIQ